MLEILVTGASGFLGSHIADALTKAGYSVTLFDLEKSIFKSKDQKMILGDIRDFDTVNQALEGKDIVYHLAALADLNKAKTKPLETVDVNIKGTINLLEASRLQKIKRFVFGSSVYVYSQHGGFYRCSKQACENYIEEYSQRFGLHYTILRYGSLYGKRTDSTNGVYRLLEQFMTKNEIHYNGAREDKREYIHVEDAAKLSVQILEKQFEDKHITLTGNDRLSIGDLFMMFQEILNRNVDVKYSDENNNSGHYALTPYTFTPKLGNKLVSNEYVDMGQGLIQVIEMIHNEQRDK